MECQLLRQPNLRYTNGIGDAMERSEIEVPTPVCKHPSLIRRQLRAQCSHVHLENEKDVLCPIIRSCFITATALFKLQPNMPATPSRSGLSLARLPFSLS